MGDLGRRAMADHFEFRDGHAWSVRMVDYH
jgi:hypothetical protein